MKQFPPFAGVLPIIQTPFTESDKIDWDTLSRQLEWAIGLGIHGVGTGMVSEINRLSLAERHEYSLKLVEFAAGRIPVFMSVSAASRVESVGYARDAAHAGVQAIMAAPPLGESLDAAGLVGYYRVLAETTSLPVIVQDASGYLGQAIPHSVYLDLLQKFGTERIWFKPEAPPNGPNISLLRDATAGQARIFEGSGGVYLVDSFRRGVHGTMPGMDCLPAIIRIWHLLSAGKEKEAYELYFPVCSLVALQMQAGLDGFLAIEKHALVRRGLFPSARRRAPVKWEMDSETTAEVDRLLTMLDDRLAEMSE